MLAALSQQFDLDPRLAGDTHGIGDWPLSRLLLMNDSRYDWIILVPRVASVTEWTQLSEAQQQQGWLESAEISRLLLKHGRGQKLNTGALGNVVAQLHGHHVMRHSADPAWPGPVWGHSAPQPYTATAASQRVATVRSWIRSAGSGLSDLLKDL